MAVVVAVAVAVVVVVVVAAAANLRGAISPPGTEDVHVLACVLEISKDLQRGRDREREREREREMSDTNKSFKHSW